MSSRTPQEIVQAILAAGGSIRVIQDGKAVVQGEIPADVMEDVRAQRDAVIEAWEAHERDRWMRPPPDNIAFRRKPTGFNAATRRRVSEYVQRQGGEVARWALLRAEAYSARCPGWSEAEWTASACSDVIHWQLARHPAPVTVLVDLYESLEEMKP